MRFIGALLAFTAGLSCADGTGPPGILGSYAPEQVGSDVLPAGVYVSQDVTIRVLADTLRLHESGVGTRIDLAQLYGRVR